MCYAMDALNNYDDARQQLKTLEEMQGEVYEVNRAHGWFDAERSFGDTIALLHSELSEALEAFRDWGLADATKPCVYDVHSGEPNPDRLPKPEGVGSEYADVFIRLLDACQRDGINLRAEYERKLAYNRTRPHLHGGRAL